MLVIGLTGGISSGKSTVAALFAKKNIPVIDADEITRQLTKPGQKALDEIVQLFGESILLPDGTLDRRKLRQLVFSDSIKRKKLEQILHPLVRIEMQSRIATLDAPYCIAMIPLLLETDPNPLIQRILVIDTSEELQISRTITRDKTSLEEVQEILMTQVNRSKRLQLADDVIINQGTLEELIPEVDKLHEQYLRLAKKVS